MYRYGGYRYWIEQANEDIWSCCYLWALLLQLQLVSLGDGLKLVLIVLMLTISGVGLQIPPWLYGVEITPLKLRYIAGAVSAASGKCSESLFSPSSI
jgi:hypothetical protein